MARRILDITGIVQRMLPPAAVLARRVQLAVQAAWAAEARANLGRSAKTVSAYVGGIQPAPTSNAGVELVGTYPNMFELGLGPGGVGTEGPFDLRDTLLKPTTRSIRQGKRGLYLFVPFHMTVAAIKAAGGNAAVKQARGLPATTSQNGRTFWGGRLPPGLAPKQRPHHATDPLAGLVRKEAPYSAASGGGGQSTYHKWRTISQNGKPWIHPGIQAKHLADRVLAKMGAIMAAAFGP